MNSEISWSLLAKFLANETNQQEKEQVKYWIDSDPLNRQLFESLESTWKASSDRSVQWDVDKAWMNIASRLDLETGTRQKSRESIPSEIIKRKFIPATRLLSTVTLIIIISLAAFIYNDASRQPVKVTNVKNAVAMHFVSTEKGQRASFKLSDGTEVFLNSASTIKFPQKFTGSKRLVYLDGEAYFKVVHNDLQPFKVMINNAEITDIGTEFDVRAWKDDGIASVTVKEGKVSFQSEKTGDNKIVYLSEKQSSYMNKDGILSLPATTNVDQHIGWINGKLYFENSTLQDVFKALDRSYNFTCSVKDSSLLSLHLTAAFNGDNFKEVVNIISLALNLNHKISGNSCRFTAGRNSGLKIKNRHSFSN